jgi:hypothetical protein
MSDIAISTDELRTEGDFIGLSVDQVLPDEEMRNEIITFITDELEVVQTDRESVEEDWTKWKRQRMAKPLNKVNNSPWPNASNQVVPLAATNTNSLFATTKEKFGSRIPLISVSSSDPTYRDHADALTDLVSTLLESKHHIDIRKKNLTLLYELVSLGTQFVKVPWRIKKWTFKRDGQQVDKVVMDSPDVIPIPIEDFFCKLHISDIQQAPWVAVRTRYMDYELKQHAANGIFENVEDVLSFSSRELPDHTIDQLDQQNMTSTLTEDGKEYEIYETYVFWDVDGDGIPEDIKLFIHKDAKVILRAEFNELGLRDIVRIPYMNIPYQLYASGVGQMVERLQDESDTLHNMRINSQHLSSLQGMVTRTGSRHLDDFVFQPLFNLKTDNPREDVVPFKFPDISTSTFQAESIVMQYADRLTGAGNAMMGQPDDQAKTRATASGTMFLAQQGYKLYESISKNIEEGYGEIGLMIVYQLVANSERAIDSVLPLVSEERRPLVMEILNMHPEDIPSRFNFHIRVTEVDKTEEAKLQKAMMLQQLYGAYLQQTVGMAEKIFMMQQQAPQLLEPVMKLYVGQTKIMEEVIELLTDKDPSEFTVYVKDIDMMLKQQEMQKDQQVAEVGNAIRQQQAGVQEAVGYSGGAGGQFGGSTVSSGDAGVEETPEGGM